MCTDFLDDFCIDSRVELPGKEPVRAHQFICVFHRPNVRATPRPTREVDEPHIAVVRVFKIKHSTGQLRIP